MRKQTGGGILEIKQYSGEVGQENEEESVNRDQPKGSMNKHST